MAGIGEDHDLIGFPEITAQGIIAEIGPFYEAGHSIPEISKMTGIPRTSVRDHLIHGGISLRPSTHVLAPREKRNSGQVRWNSPYGFQYLKGKLAPHPQEFETLRLILSRFHGDDSYEAISSHLNARKLRPRSAKVWTRFTVRQIVKWHQANPHVLSDFNSVDHSTRGQSTGKVDRVHPAKSGHSLRNRSGEKSDL